MKEHTFEITGYWSTIVVPTALAAHVAENPVNPTIEGDKEYRLADLTRKVLDLRKEVSPKNLADVIQSAVLLCYAHSQVPEVIVHDRSEQLLHRLKTTGSMFSTPPSPVQPKA